MISPGVVWSLGEFMSDCSPRACRETADISAGIHHYFFDRPPVSVRYPMIALSVSITGITALVVIGTAMLLVTTPAPPDSVHLPHPVAFRVGTQSYDGHIIFWYIPSYDHSIPGDGCRPYSVSSMLYENATTFASIDQVRHEISGLEPLQLLAPCNPGDTCSLAMVIWSPDGRGLHNRTTAIRPGETCRSAPERISSGL